MRLFVGLNESGFVSPNGRLIMRLPVAISQGYLLSSSQLNVILNFIILPKSELMEYLEKTIESVDPNRDSLGEGL